MDNNIALTALRQEINWLKLVISQSLATYLVQDGHEKNWRNIPLPDLSISDSPYARFVKEWKLNVYARLALALSMAPHLDPEVLDVFLIKNQITDRGFTEFGGVSNENYKGFLPNGQTLCFIVTVNQPEMRIELMDLLGKKHILYRENVLRLAETEDNLPWLSGQLILGKDWFNYFLTGEEQQIEYSVSFPAQKITTVLAWDDLVLDDLAVGQVREITAWIKYNKTLMEGWELGKKMKPGYRALFYGLPGTGKTLTATLIGKFTGFDVYRIDLPKIISSYVGETEKKIFKIFEVARRQNWILFIDDAGALTGKYRDDLSINQPFAYLLQKIEDYPGIVILSASLRNDIDGAFARKFQNIIHFAMPTVEERYKLWQNAFSGVCKLDENIDLHTIANEYELTGGSIINVLRYCALSAIARDSKTVTEEELLAGIKRETTVIKQ